MLPMATRTRKAKHRSNSKRKAKAQIEAVDILILALLLVAANFFVENTVWLAPALVAAASIFVAYKRLTRKRKRKILLLKELDDLSSDGKEFEERIKLLLEDLGWHNTQRRGGPGDRGVDLVAKSASKKYRSCGTDFEDKKLRATLQELPHSLKYEHGAVHDYTKSDAAPAAPLRD
jgi:hypothetical protein